MNITIKDEQILKQLRDNGKSKQERTRAGAILLSNSDVHRNDIAKIYDVTIRSVFNWFKEFKNDGILSLKCKTGRGRKPLLDATKHKKIIQNHMRLYPHQPKTAYAFTMEDTGIKMSYDTFKLFLKKTQLQLQTSKKRYR